MKDENQVVGMEKKMEKGMGWRRGGEGQRIRRYRRGKSDALRVLLKKILEQ